MLRQIISGKTSVCQVKKFSVEPPNVFRYNNYINRRESHMTDNEFFRLDQLQWYAEYVETQLPKNLVNSYPHTEKFEFDDVPF
jgi:hypothetical protein